MPKSPALAIPSQPVLLRLVFAALALPTAASPWVGPPSNSRTLNNAARSWRNGMLVSVCRTVIAALTYTLVQMLFEPGRTASKAATLIIRLIIKPLTRSYVKRRPCYFLLAAHRFDGDQRATRSAPIIQLEFRCLWFAGVPPRYPGALALEHLTARLLGYQPYFVEGGQPNHT